MKSEKEKLRNVYISSGGYPLVTVREFKNGKVHADEIGPKGVETVELNPDEESEILKIGEGIPVYGILDKDGDVFTKQLPFYFDKESAMAAARLMRDHPDKNGWGCTVKKGYLIYVYV